MLPASAGQLLQPPSEGGCNQISGSLGRDFAVHIQHQLCNLTDMSILPIDKVRSHLPTAAELSACVFSDDEKASHHSGSSDSSGHKAAPGNDNSGNNQ